MYGGTLRATAAAVIVLVSTAGFLMLLLAEDLAASGSSLSDLSTSGDFLQPGSDGTAELGLDRLTFQSGGESRVIPNHGVVSLGDVQLEVAVSPYPPTSFDLDVELVATSTAGEAVTDADIVAIWDMTVMHHGPFETHFTNIGDGRYTAFFDLFMVGPWELELSVAAPGVQPAEDVSLIIYVWPE